MDGEYMLLGRVTEDTSNIFVQYGQGDTRTVNVTGGPGVQESEFIDGMRISVQADAPMRFNVDLANGIEPSSLSTGMMAVSKFPIFDLVIMSDTSLADSFRWVVNSSAPTQKIKAQILFPVNVNMVSAVVPSPAGAEATSPRTAVVFIAKRPLGSIPGTMFVTQDTEIDQVRATSSSLNGAPNASPVETRLSVGNLDSIDGEYVLLVTPGQMGATTASQGKEIRVQNNNGGEISMTKPAKSNNAGSSLDGSVRATGAHLVALVVTVLLLY